MRLARPPRLRYLPAAMSSEHPNIVTHSGLPLGATGALVAKSGQSSEPIVAIARDDRRAEAMIRSIRFFKPNLPVFMFPAWDCLPYDRVSPNAEVSARRTALLYRLSQGVKGPFVLVTTLGAATQYVPAPAYMREAGFKIVEGRTINLDALKTYLVRMGFALTPTVTEPGDYAIRGGIIDIFPPGERQPIRLDLFGDTVDGIRRFDPMSQKTTENLTQVSLAPASEVILDEEAITRFRNQYRADFGAAGNDDPLYEAVSAGRRHQGVEHWLPLFQDPLATLFDYVEADQILLDDNFDRTHDDRWAAIADQYDARMAALSAKSSLASVYKPARPDTLYLDPTAFYQALARKTVRKIAELPKATGPGVVDEGFRVGRNFAPERQADDRNVFAALAGHLDDLRQKVIPVVASFSDGARDRLAGLLRDNGVEAQSHIRTSGEVTDQAITYLTSWPLDEGFVGHDIAVISEQDVLGDRLVRKPSRKRRAENFLTEATSLSVDDLVVHVEHGVGRFRGLETITAAGAPHDCILLEYANQDRLYLPVENIELLSRYGHEEGMLDRLGGGAWQAKKAKLKERIKDMADRLIRIAAERALRKGVVMEPQDSEWERFSARFPYTETDDQLAAIEDVVSDMASGRPMDRLVCGDVGFGKTEVALRAAFVAASTGGQVAVIAPTTLLARQHFKSFSERFRNTGLNVCHLSRFVSTKEANETREGLKSGLVDIVVGTHAVLAKQVEFKALGLLIIDEEQRFGVQHKERLKQLRSDVHVLTLTATPIPRTLQLSLAGVRELSIISTPPVDRLSIRTYVSEFDPVTIREALLREHYRGGQSFVVVPRISDLPELETFLREQVPEISFVVAHGQMAAGDLDERMNAFYDGRYDVLLATTIVESGLDIPAANTMIVYRADKFGLAQLYQIRGRVGRSKTRAYAYLTTKPRAPITKAAEKRLRVLGAIDSLGAGFNLASQDLDMRGAGNILGEEQSGQVREVGYELYQDMLNEAIAKLKSGDANTLTDMDERWSPQIKLGVPVLIPEGYVTDLDVRLGLYRRMSSLTRKVELEGFAAELIDRFGPLPDEVDILLKVVRIKALCRAAGIEKLEGGPKGAVIEFHKDKFAKPEGLVKYLHESEGTAKIKDNRLVVLRDWPNDAKKIAGAMAIARDLAVLAKG
ncbi:MAG: transcription-repair coupling factor [Pseudomonadota bacterium]